MDDEIQYQLMSVLHGKILFKSIKNENFFEFYFLNTDNEFKKNLEIIPSLDYDLVSLFCVENFESFQGFSLFYVFEQPKISVLVIFIRILTTNETTSISQIYPSASWYEREIQDGFGIEFIDAFDKRSLFLHEIYPADFHPLQKSFANHPIMTKESVKPEEEYQFRPINGEGVYQIPVGPVHAGIIEPGHFRFSVIGETVFNLEIRMFYKHRGIEKLSEDKSPRDVVQIAETISGDETVANAIGYCDAVEQIATINVPPRALRIRVILLELERIYSLLSDIAGMIVDVAYPVGASPFFILREEIFRMNATLTNSRFLKRIITIGGLNFDISNEKLNLLILLLNSFEKRFNKAVNFCLSSSSVIDRIETTGIIKLHLIKALHLTGPQARACGVNIDTRKDHPYSWYSELAIVPKTEQNGDVLARYNVKVKEINSSIDIIRTSLKHIPNGPINIEYTLKNGYASSLVEASRGQSFHWVYIKNGKVDRYKIRTASFCNWQAIQHCVLGNIVPDFPLINKSLNLSYAGTDL